MPAFDLPGEMIPGQFGPMIRVRLPFAHRVRPEPRRVVHRDPLGDHHGQPDRGVDRLDHRALGERRRHEDDADIGAGLLHRLLDRRRRPARSCPPMVTEVPALRAFTPPTMFVPAASIFVGVLGALGPGQALDDDLAVLVQEDRHDQAPATLRKLGGLVGRIVHRVRLGDQRVVRRVEDPPALGDVVAVQPHDQRLARLVTAAIFSASTMPLATASHAVIPPNTLTNTLLTSGSRRIDVQPVRHHLRRRAAADVEEVRRLHPAVLLTGVGHHVQRGHHQARTVADDPDLPSSSLT